MLAPYAQECFLHHIRRFGVVTTQLPRIEKQSVSTAVKHPVPHGRSCRAVGHVADVLPDANRRGVRHLSPSTKILCNHFVIIAERGRPAAIIAPSVPGLLAVPNGGSPAGFSRMLRGVLRRRECCAPAGLSALAPSTPGHESVWPENRPRPR